MTQLAASTTPKPFVASRSVWVGRALSSLVILFSGDGRRDEDRGAADRR